MELGRILNDSLGYGKDIVWGKWVRWILLIFCTLFFPLVLGYEVEIYRGNKPAPDWCRLERFFTDGLKLLVIEIIYAIPTLLVMLVFIGAGLFALRSPAGAMAMWGAFAVGFVITLIVAFITFLVEAMGVVRFARTGEFGEAFNFHAIFGRIGQIGWGSYILALLVVCIIAGVIAIVLSAIPLIGWLLLLIVLPPLVIFVAQFITLVYDGVPAEAPPAAAPPAA